TIPTREFLSKSGQDMLEWTPRGPIRIGGRTRALGIDRRNPNIVNAGGVSGGMWHSTNGGASWTKATRPDQHHSVTTLIQDPRPGQEDIWYYGSGEFIGNSANAPGGPYLGTGLYRSTDNGTTWELFGFEPAGESPVFDRAYDVFFNLAIDPTNTSQLEVYAATYGLIYRFDGVTREPLLIDDPNSPTFSSFSDVAVTDGGVVYAALSSDGGMGGLWQSPDGDEWTEITPAGWPSVFQRVVIGIAPSDQNIVYFLGHAPGTGPSDHSLWRYHALDASWEDRTANLPTGEQFSVHSNFPQDRYRHRALPPACRLLPRRHAGHGPARSQPQAVPRPRRFMGRPDRQSADGRAVQRPQQFPGGSRGLRLPERIRSRHCREARR